MPQGASCPLKYFDIVDQKNLSIRKDDVLLKKSEIAQMGARISVAFYNMME